MSIQFIYQGQVMNTPSLILLKRSLASGKGREGTPDAPEIRPKTVYRYAYYNCMMLVI